MDSLRCLLDTNILSDLIRHPNGRVTQCLRAVLPAAACTSMVVTSEIHFGLNQRGSKKLHKQAELIMGALEILPLECPADRHYGEIRAELTRRGALIGQHDLLIPHRRPAPLYNSSQTILHFGNACWSCATTNNYQ